jgi:hypothetical protein
MLQAFHEDEGAYVRVKCRRIGMSVDWFSSVGNRTILGGTVTYESNKNYRSNVEFGEFKERNVLQRKALVVLTSGSIQQIVKTFGTCERFFSPAFDHNAPLQMVGFNTNKFKIRKSKNFFIKVKRLLLNDQTDRRQLLVDNATLEFSCTLRD